MKIKIQSKKLAQALDTASLGMVGRINLPALSCCLLECEGKTIRVTADSLQARVSVNVEAESIDEPFSMLVAPRFLKSAMRAEQAELRYNEAERRLKVISGGETTLNCVAVTEFPAAWKAVKTSEVDAVSFIGAIKAAAACAGDPYDFIYWDQSEGRCLGTNGKWFTLRPLETPAASSFVLPSAMAKLIGSCFEADGLQMGQDGFTIHLTQGDKSAWIKSVEVAMLPWKSFLIDCLPFALVGRECLQNAMESLADFSESEFNKVTVTPKDGGWTALSKSLSGESIVPIAEVEKMEGDGTEPFTFSRVGMLNAIRYWQCDKIKFRRNGNLIMLTPENENGTLAVAPLYRAD